MLGEAVNSFVVLFVVVDPISIAPLFVALSHGMARRERRRIALRASAFSTLILVIFFFMGEHLLDALGVELPSFRIAGGALLFLLAIEMVFARQSGLRTATVRERAEASRREDISVFPLAFPLLAGPGAITTVLLMAARSDAPEASAAMLAVIVLVMAVSFLALLISELIMAGLGETGANVITRLFGLILAALAVQFVVDGLREVVQADARYEMRDSRGEM